MFSYQRQVFLLGPEAVAKVARTNSLIQFIVDVLLIDNDDHGPGGHDALRRSRQNNATQRRTNAGCQRAKAASA
jgi:hypothetical protein